MDLLLTGCSLFGSRVNIGITDGRFSYVGTESPTADVTYDLQGKIVLPGMIDPHVHVRDLEQSEKEEWGTASRAALAGGVTTIFDMPNSIPATNDIVALRRKMDVAKKSLVNYGFHVGADLGSYDNLVEMVKTERSSIAGIKIYLAATSSNEVLDSAEHLDVVMKLANEHNLPVLFHHELQSTLEESQAQFSGEQYNDIFYHDAIRSRKCETDGTELVIDLARRNGSRAYVCHISVAEGFDLVNSAKKSGVKLYTEVTPHHLFLNKDVTKIVGNFGKINPPLRSETDRAYMYRELCEHRVDAIGSDHAPHSRESKLQSYNDAPSGFPGLETSYPLMIDAALKGDFTLQELATQCAEKPAQIFCLKDRGVIKEGFAADFVVVDKNMTHTIDSSKFFTKAKFSPYEGMNLQGHIVETWVNGVKAFSDGEVIAERAGEALSFI